MCDISAGCECTIAVKRVYRELRGRNVRDADAFETAVRIHRFHHPDLPSSEALHTVSRLLDGHGAAPESPEPAGR